MVTPDPFQPADGSWSAYAALPGLRSVLDPNDVDGRKNRYIDALHRLAIDQTIARGTPGRVLDFGCGTGRIARHLHAAGFQVVGVEITEEAVRVAARSSPKDISYLRIDGARLPLQSSSVDLAVSVYVLQYVVGRSPEVYRQIAAELSRVIRPGGRWVFLEQVIPAAKGSTSVGSIVHYDDYLRWGEALPLSLLESRVVRLASPSALERRTILQRGFPRFLEPFVIRAILRRNRRLTESDLRTQPYVDRIYTVARHG